MLNSHYPIDILDGHGQVIGSKPLKDLDKQRDIYHTVNILLITPRGELILQVIPENDVLPVIYSGTLGTIAAVKRSNESVETAAHRCMSRQLFIDEMPLHKLGTGMYNLVDGRRLCISSFYGIADPPASFSLFDIECLVVMSPRQLDKLVVAENPFEHVAINLFTVWQTHRNTFFKDRHANSELLTLWQTHRNKLPV